MESYRDHTDDGNRHSPPLHSKLLWQRACEYEDHLNVAPLSRYELDQGAWAICYDLNRYAREHRLMGERASVPAAGAAQSRIERGPNGEHNVRRYQATGLDGLEVLTGKFIGYGYYLLPDERHVVFGTRLVTGYDATLPFSEGAIVTFCPLTEAQPEFETELKERRMNEIRKKLEAALHDISPEVQQVIHDIDVSLSDEAIEDIRFLHTVSLKVELLLARDDILPDHPAVYYLVELIAQQLDLPMTVTIETSSYQGETTLSPTYVKYPPRLGAPRLLDNFEARLIVAHNNQRYGLYFAGIKNEQMIRVALDDVIAVEPSEQI